MSNVSKGNYYKKKTKDWFVKQGYHTEYLEHVSSIFTPRGIIYKKTDCLGSDGVSLTTKEIIFWNSKFTDRGLVGVNQMSTDGQKEFEKFPFPDCVKRQLIIWQPRVKFPVVVNCI